ncbi:Nucleoporin nup85 [Blyttiomyces sp. JEL0837]|nr:Nucleoporin nup85 [Blyttiomyces sp. JEL0837]
MPSLLAQNRTFGATICPSPSTQHFTFFAAKSIIPSSARGASIVSASHFKQDNQGSIVDHQPVPVARITFINSTFTVFNNLQIMWKMFEKSRGKGVAGSGVSSSQQRMSGGGLVGAAMGRDDGGSSAMDEDEPSSWTKNVNERIEFGGASSSSSSFGMVKREHLMKISSLYKEAIQTQSLSLSAAVAGSNLGNNNNNNNTDMGDEIPLFNAMNAIWSLSEVMLMGREPSEPVGEDLIQWTSILANGDSSCIKGGPGRNTRLGFATSTPTPLSKTSSAGSHPIEELSANPVTVFTKLLHTMPRPSSFPSTADFESRWQKWRAEVLYQAEPAMVDSLVTHEPDRPHFETLFGIISGNEDIILEVAQEWSEAFVALVIYTNPCVVSCDVGGYLDSVRDLIADADSAVDSAMAAIIDLDVDLAVRLLTKIDWWLVAHLTDLLDKFGQLDEAEGKHPIALFSKSLDEILKGFGGSGPGASGGKSLVLRGAGGLSTAAESSQTQKSAQTSLSLRDWYVLEYGETLATHPSLWRVGVEYLSYGGPSAVARSRFELNLLRIDPAHASQVTQNVGILSETWVTEVAKTLHRVVARRCLRQGRLGESVYHYTEAEDLGKAAAVGELLMEEHLDFVANKKVHVVGKGTGDGAGKGGQSGAECGTNATDTSSATLAIEKFGPKSLAGSNYLLFLSKYRRFETLYAAAREAGCEKKASTTTTATVPSSAGPGKSPAGSKTGRSQQHKVPSPSKFVDGSGGITGSVLLVPTATHPYCYGICWC